MITPANITLIMAAVMVYTRHRGQVARYGRREGVMEGLGFVRWVAGKLSRRG